MLEQVHHDDAGPWIPIAVPSDGGEPEIPEQRDIVYDGVAGLALALAELRLARPLDRVEDDLAAAIVDRLAVADLEEEASLHLGLSGAAAATALLDRRVVPGMLARLAAQRTDDGWPSRSVAEPAVPVNDIVLGDAGTLLACAWLEDSAADELPAGAADALLARAFETDDGLAWTMYQGDRDRWMPNYSHGTAGVATALAVTGHRLGRDDLVEAARRGATHLVGLADLDDDGFRLPLQIPPAEDREQFAYGWCHGPTGTIHLFGALQLAGIEEVAGTTTAEWRARCIRSLRTSGLPDRLRPGFWDNDGRCCGTAGVLDVVLTEFQATADADLLAFADRLAAMPGRPCRAHDAGRVALLLALPRAPADPPELDPGVGWMQGAAGIVAALSRYARVRRDGATAPRLALPDNWWMHHDPPTS